MLRAELSAIVTARVAQFRRRRCLPVRRRLLIVLIALAGGVSCAPVPAFTGNGTNIRMQGGTAAQDMYVNQGWHDECNQVITDASGSFEGWYVDDSVNVGTSAIQEANCVYYDHVVFRGALIVAASPPGEPGWDFAFWGATYTAFEEYPFCGSTIIGDWPPPPERAYIVQWNFTWSGCAPTPFALLQRLASKLSAEDPQPTLILFY